VFVVLVLADRCLDASPVLLVAHCVLSDLSIVEALQKVSGGKFACARETDMGDSLAISTVIEDLQATLEAVVQCGPFMMMFRLRVYEPPTDRKPYAVLLSRSILDMFRLDRGPMVMERDDFTTSRG
jgi:hypothetical protein